MFCSCPFFHFLKSPLGLVLLENECLVIFRFPKILQFNLNRRRKDLQIFFVFYAIVVIFSFNSCITSNIFFLLSNKVRIFVFCEDFKSLYISLFTNCFLCIHGGLTLYKTKMTVLIQRKHHFLKSNETGWSGTVANLGDESRFNFTFYGVFHVFIF